MRPVLPALSLSTHRWFNALLAWYFVFNGSHYTQYLGLSAGITAVLLCPA